MTPSEAPLDRDAAVARAIDLLRAAFGSDLRHPDAGEVVVNHRLVAEHDNAWAIPFGGRSFVENGDRTHLLVPSVVVVPKGGAPAHYAPSAMAVADYLAAVASGERSWRRPPVPPAAG